MDKQTQCEWVLSELKTFGFVTRNQALGKHITRLASRIQNLKDDGWQIEGEKRKTAYGVDYVYSLVECEVNEVKAPEAENPKETPRQALATLF